MATDKAGDQARVSARGATVRLAAPQPLATGDLTEEMVASDWWTDSMIHAAGIPIVDFPLVAVGGGIGSFVTVDYLRIAGVTPDRSEERRVGKECRSRW